MTCFGGSRRGFCFPWKQQIHNSDKRSYVGITGFAAVGFTVVLGIFLQIEVLFATIMIISFIFELYIKSLFKYQIH
jgi:hypothetical protein